MPASERDYMRDDDAPRRPRLSRGRLALWIGMAIVLMIGEPLTGILAWGWALLLLFGLILAAQIVSWHWLHPQDDDD